MKKTNRSQLRQSGKRAQVFKSEANLGSARLRAIPFALALVFGSTSLFADPMAGEVVAGYAAISAANGITTVNQMSDRAVVNWQSFNVNAGEAVKFVQPSSTAAILNRVTGGSVSNINGLIEGNGRVYLINPNGIVVGANGVVNVNGGFVASTKSLADNAFMSGGALVFTGESTGSIQILGKVQSAQGDVILIAPKIAIEKTGSLIAGQTIKLVAANEVELSNGKFTVKPKAVDAGQLTVEGALEAAKVQLAANSNNLGALAINTTGTIRATGTQTNPDGSVSIIATGEGGSINISGNIRSEKGDGNGGAVTVLADNNIRVSGTIDANSTDATKKGGDIIIGRDLVTGALAKTADFSGATLLSNKGFVETSGDYLATDGITVKAAQWLLDPSNITIQNVVSNSNLSGAPNNILPTGGNGTSSIVATSTIQDAIKNGTSVTIQTTNNSDTTSAGNITIADALNFTNITTNAATLSLIADNGITQNAAITTTGGTGLVNISMEAKGNYKGTDAANANSKGITLNSTITTNGDVTLNGTNQNTGVGRSNSGVVFNGGSGITAKEIKVTGIQKRSGTTDANGIAFSGSTTFTSTGTGASVFDGTSSSIGNASAGVYVEDGAKLNLNSGAGSMHFKGDNTNPGYRGIRLGFVSPATTNINTSGNVIFGTDTNVKQTFLRANLNVNSGSVTLQGSEVQFYDGAVLTAKNGTTVNLIGQTINLGQAGSAVIKKDSGGFDLNMVDNKVMVQSGASVDVGTGTVSVKTLTPGWEIQLGADDAATKMGLTNAELGLIKAGQVVIGDTSSNGAITVAGATSTNATTGNLTLQTGGSITVSRNLNAGSGKNLTLLAKGDVTVGATISQAGNGNIVIAAGFDKQKQGDDPSGHLVGQVKRAGSGSVTNSSGHTYIYTGSVSGSTVMGNLNSSFNTLLLDNTTAGSPQNAQSNAAFGSTLGIPGSNTASMQVLYREKIGVNLTGVLSDANKVYGDIGSNTGNTEARAALNAANTFTTWTTASSSFKIKTTALVDTMSLTGDTYSASNHLNANAAGYGFTSSTYTLSNGPKLFVAKANLTKAEGSKTYDGQTATLVAGSNGTLTLTGVVGETATLVATNSVELTNPNAGTRAVKGLGSHAAFTSANGLDLNNYNVADTDFAALALANNAVTIRKATATVTADSAIKSYNGLLQTISGFKASGLVAGETEVVLSGVRVSGSGQNVGVYDTTASGSDNNYNLSFIDGTLTINYSGFEKAPTPPETYTRIAGDVVNLAPVSFAVGVAPSTAAGDEADPNICYAWGQRNGGSVTVHTLLKPSYLGLRNAKTDTQEAMSNSGGSSSSGASPCDHEVSTFFANADNI